jgi:hypothetical protein
MTTPRLTRPGLAHAYRLPDLLHDIRLLDLLELSGTTVQAGRLLGLSQPTVSRRYQHLAADFGLVRDRRQRQGCGYGTSACIQMLRLGCRSHRLDAGVARLGGDWLLQPLLAECGWLLPTPRRFRCVDQWLELVRQGVLDGALISGHDLPWGRRDNAEDLDLVRVGDVPLALAFDPRTDDSAEGPVEVLVPDQTVAPWLWRALGSVGLTLRSAGSALRGPSDWIRRIQATPLALVVLDRRAAGWASLRRAPLPQPLAMPVWLALPADWSRQPVLRHTMESARQALPPLPAS